MRGLSGKVIIVTGGGGGMRCVAEVIAAACVGAALLVTAHAEEKDPRPAAGIQDNSFLVEEAYNQEAGVIQHINTLRRVQHDWLYTFTQEWPVGGQDNQFSYSVPYSWIRNDLNRRVSGVGDVYLNYRRQVLYESATQFAFAPRVSLILPTGDRSAGLGDGSYGTQINLPFSKIVSDRVTLHANAGMTTLFGVDGHRPTSFNVGGSAIYAVSRDFNLMLEALTEWNQSVNAAHELERETSFTISPGFRSALNFPDLADLQVVFGAALPITFSQSKSTDFGAFFYLSFEHSIEKKSPK